MGEAKRRGDYQKRKAEAIAAGRVKVERRVSSRLLTGPELFANLLAIFTTKNKSKANMRRNLISSGILVKTMLLLKNGFTALAQSCDMEMII